MAEKGQNLTIKLLFAALVFMVIVPLTVQAQEAAVVDLVVANSKVDLLVFFKIEDAFSEDMHQGVLHGIPVTFTFDFVLDRVRKGWIDREVRAGTFEHTMTYDSLKKEFTVTHQELNGSKLVTADLNKALEFMVEVDGVKVVALEEMRPDYNYTLRVKVTLVKTTLPLNFHYIIPFTEFWDLKTDWTEVDFRY